MPTGSFGWGGLMLQDPKPPMNPKETSLITHPDASMKMYDIIKKTKQNNKIIEIIIEIMMKNKSKKWTTDTVLSVKRMQNTTLTQWCHDVNRIHLPSSQSQGNCLYQWHKSQTMTDRSEENQRIYIYIYIYCFVLAKVVSFFLYIYTIWW